MHHEAAVAEERGVLVGSREEEIDITVGCCGQLMIMSRKGILACLLRGERRSWHAPVLAGKIAHLTLVRLRWVARR